MSRRAVLSGILALSAFGLATGLTASMSVASSDLGAASNTVSACDADGIDLAFGLTPGNISTLSAVTLSGVDAACDGQSVLVELVGSGGVLEQLTGTADTSGQVVLTPSGAIAAADVTGVNTVITG